MHGTKGKANTVIPAGDPAVSFGRERRLHARAYDLWVSLLRGRRMPLISDLDLEQVPDFAARSVLFAVDETTARPTISFLGAGLREQAGIDADRPNVTDIPPESMLAALIGRFHDIVAYRAPIGFEAEFGAQDGRPSLHRGILLPFADEDGRLAAVYGVISWKLAAEVRGTPDISAAVASAFNARPATAPTSVWGDGPGTAIREEPGVSAVQPIDRRIAAARTWAALAQADRTKSSASLHAALGAAYDLLLETRPDHDARATIDLVFGGPLSTLSRVQLRRYAMVLEHGMRLGLGSGRLAAWLDRQTGGHRAAAVQERRARWLAARAERVTADQLWASTQPAIGHLTLSPVDADFLLLVGRRAPRGVDVIAPVPHDMVAIETALARVRAA